MLENILSIALGIFFGLVIFSVFMIVMNTCGGVA